LPSYEEHLHRFPESLLCRYLGLHRIRLDVESRTVEGVFPERWFIIMKSAFYTSLAIHEKYDLKGSSWGRWASEGDLARGCPLLDLDWKAGTSKFSPLRLRPDDQDTLLAQYVADTALLQHYDVVDYSILMGIHDLQHDWKNAPASPSLRQTCAVTLSPGSKSTSASKAIPTGDSKVPGAVKSQNGLLVIFCLIDTLEPYDFERQIQHGVGGAVTTLISAFGYPCEQAIVDPLSYRERQMQLFRDIVQGKAFDSRDDEESSWWY